MSPEHLLAIDISNALPAVQMLGTVVLAYDPGDRIEQGSELARLDDEPYRLAVAVAESEVARLEARVRELENEMRRMRSVSAEGYVSESELESAEAQLEGAREQLSGTRNRREEAQRDLRHTSILAPLSGRVDQRMISEGDFLSSGDAAFRIDPDSRYRVQLPFPEVMGDRLSEGMPVRIRRLGRDADGPVDGWISSLRPAVDQGARAVVAVAEFDKPDDWRTGTLVEGIVILERREEVVLVPRVSVVERPVGTVVFVLSGSGNSGQVEERRVSIGYRTVDEVEITDGLETGEQVVSDGASFLSGGARVRIRNGD
jgi:RND family efflux transporter MFP subunit